MSTRRSVVVVAALLLVLGTLAPKAWAGEPADQLFAQIDRVLKVLDDPELKKPGHEQERQQTVRRLMAEMLDIEEISRLSLGRHWEARTASEREEFMQLFGGLIERAYIGKIESFSDERIAVLGDATDGDLATVQTKVVTKQGAEIPIEYHMLRRGAHWRTYDVVLGGISLVDNYRAQFDKIIRRTSYQQLVKQVREKQ
jgi:phospholipid transport system substrate-binding protein